MLRRSYNAEAFNEILNHPTIKPYVIFGEQEELDCTEILENANNILLVNEFGGIFFKKIEPTVYQAHTQFLPEGRGRRAKEASIFAVDYMFKNTDCLKILAAIPSYNRASKIIAQRVGFEYTNTIEKAWPQNNEVFDVDNYILNYEKWITNDDR